MGGKGSQTTTNQNQTYTANPAIQASGTQALGMAQGAAQQPFQMPVAPVAGFSQDQQSAFNQYRQMQGSFNPYAQQASDAYGKSATPITAGDVSQYYNPMVDSVTKQLQNIFGQQNTQNTGNLAQSAGGIGADRIAVGQGNMANQQTLAAGQTYAGLYQQALQAAQQQKQMEAGAGAGFTNVGTALNQNNLADTQAFLNSGNLQQQQSQAQLNAPYQNTLARIAYPFQTAQYLAGITGSLAPAFGGTTNGVQVTQPPQPSMLSQIMGIGTAGAGLYGAFNGGGSGGGSPAYGGGSAAAGDAYGGSRASPLPGLTAEDYGFGYAEGGGVDDEQVSFPGIPKGVAHDLTPIPLSPMHPSGGGGHSGPLTGGMSFPNPNGNSGNANSAMGDIANVAKTAASVLPFFLARGGVASYADAGAVDYSPDETGESPLVAAIKRNLTNFGQAKPPASNVYAPPITQNSPTVSIGPAVTPAVTPAKADSGVPTALPNWTKYTPASTNGFPGVVPPKPAAPVRVRAPSVGGEGGGGGGGSNISEAMMPREQQPYPDALDRDWGQAATRSPWMALVAAGAKMASTPGPLGVSLGQGLQAGVGHLESQRKDLTTEQGLNQKAQALYQTAKAELDKYNKMTPYEAGSLAARNKEIAQAGETGTAAVPKPITPAQILAIRKYVRERPENINRSEIEIEPQVQAIVKSIPQYQQQQGAGTAPATVAPAPPAAGLIDDAREAVTQGANKAAVLKALQSKGFTGPIPDFLK